MKFDIILPTIGRPSLNRAVQSVINQTYTNWKMYIIGDGIDAEQYPIVDELYKHPQIECYTLIERHASYGAEARNFGIRQGDAGWIAYIDDDDEWLPHHLETMVNIHNRVPEANMIRTAGQSFKMKHRHPRSSELVRKLGPVNEDDILTVGMAHTRELFYATSGWQPHDNHDHTLWNDMYKENGHCVASKVVTFLFDRT